jgi:adenylate cyclase
VSASVESAIEIQRSLRLRNEDADRPIHVRVGISVGEPVTEGGDLFGAAVQMSARLCGVASPGGIAVSTAVRELCVGKRIGFESKGALDLKGFAEPVPVFEVHLSAE